MDKVEKGEAIVMDHVRQYGYPPTQGNYNRERIKRNNGAMGKRDIDDLYGGYNDWIRSMGYLPSKGGRSGGNHLWQELRQGISDERMRQIAAEMFADIDWEANKGAYGSRS